TEGHIRLWSTATGKAHGELLGHEGEAVCLALSPDGKLLASGGRDGTARLWDVATARPHGPALWHVGQVTETAFTPDGAYLGARLAAATEKGIRLWDVAAGRPHGQLLDFPLADALLAFTPDGKRLAAMGGGGQVQMWDPATGKLHDPPFKGGEKEAAFTDLQISADGKLVATRCHFGLFLWRTDKAQELPIEDRHLTCAMRQDGMVLVSADKKGGGLTVQEPLTGRTFAPLPEARFS